MARTYIGFDNGVSGSIGIISQDDYMYMPMPAKSEQNYTKAKQNITRIDFLKLKHSFEQFVFPFSEPKEIMVMIERPMVNPGRFKATTSALRAFEAVLIFLETYNMGKVIVDSKEWQRALLPKGTEKEELKKMSAQIGKRMFPAITTEIENQGDADGILIAEYCRRMYAR